MKFTNTDKAPAAVGPYSQAVAVNGFLFTSGQIALDPATGTVVGEGDVVAQAEQVMINLKAVLEEAGSGFDKVLKTTVFLKDMGDFATVNGIYAGYFEGDYPSRSAFQVAELPKGALIEIETIAYI